MGIQKNWEDGAALAKRVAALSEQEAKTALLVLLAYAERRTDCTLCCPLHQRGFCDIRGEKPENLPSICKHTLLTHALDTSLLLL